MRALRNSVQALLDLVKTQAQNDDLWREPNESLGDNLQEALKDLHAAVKEVCDEQLEELRRVRR